MDVEIHANVGLLLVIVLAILVLKTPLLRRLGIK